MTYVDIDDYNVLACFVQVSIGVCLRKEALDVYKSAIHVTARKRFAIASWGPNVSLHDFPIPKLPQLDATLSLIIAH
jgi:hypothetical protein